MKKYRFWVLCPALFVLLLSSVCIPKAEAASLVRGCSTSGTAGNWGFSWTGLGDIGVAAVGILTQDARGNIVGNQTTNLSDLILGETFSGTITVNSDCTATAHMEIGSGAYARSADLSIVFVNKMTEGYGLFTSIVFENIRRPSNLITIKLNRR